MSDATTPTAVRDPNGVYLRTLRSMLTRRGYTVPGTLEIKNGNGFSYFWVSSPNRPPCLTVFTQDTVRVGVGIVREISKLMHASKSTDAILVSDGLTPNGSSEIRDMIEKDQFVCNIASKNLVFDWYDHKSVPLHVILTPDQKADVLKTLNVTPGQLPSIFLDDPACKYLGAHPGDLFKITRVRPNVGNCYVYRHVVMRE